MKTKPIRVSRKVLRKLKDKKQESQLRSYDAVIDKLLKKEVKL